MADQYVAEIRMFGCNFAPREWALCNGQLLSIRSNTALFSLLGVNFGGDGVTTFALPNLQGMAALSYGQGPGLSNYSIGEPVGTPSVTLTQSQLAIHSHNVNCDVNGGDQPSPMGNLLGPSGTDRGNVAYSAATSGTTVLMNNQQFSPTGAVSPLPHNNMSPYVVLNYCIALVGVFPQRP